MPTSPSTNQVCCFCRHRSGNNPDYENGRQVKLNLTLENNLLSLLKSLQTIESVNLWVTRKFEQQH